MRAIAQSAPHHKIAYVPARSIEVPESVALENVKIATEPHEADGADVVVGTVRKLADAHHPRSSAVRALGVRDALVMDESFQVDSTQYFAVADLAPRHLLVGDGGQIHPFSTVPEGLQWRGLAQDPLNTAVGVLLAHHPCTRVHRFPITRRCDGRAVPVMRNFYPASHLFGAAVPEGVRRIRLGAAHAVSSRTAALDATLETAAKAGWALCELPGAQTRAADPEIARTIVDLVVRLFARGCTLMCERHPAGVALMPERIAIAVAHTDQKLLLRALCDAAGLPGVIVNTANQLQGLEFDLTVAWHPLAGLNRPDEFHLEAGRLCVMCTRHRHACIVVGRRSDRELLEGVAPAIPVYPGAYESDAPQGWDVHRAVMAALEPSIVELPSSAVG
ncbi:MAG: hypothetical protein M0038_19255 [Pseudomonadota bacterium]|nr:hypothetical protein [Pseudomonadota bacterium]